MSQIRSKFDKGCCHETNSILTDSQLCHLENSSFVESFPNTDDHVRIFVVLGFGAFHDNYVPGQDGYWCMRFDKLYLITSIFKSQDIATTPEPLGLFQAFHLEAGPSSKLCLCFSIHLSNAYLRFLCTPCIGSTVIEKWLFLSVMTWIANPILKSTRSSISELQKLPFA